jgi:hypothetical protein
VAMLMADGDTYFEHVVLPVDMFHFKVKHKQSDKFCGWFCNPAQWIELINKATGTWLFNSSAAEQVNLWFRGLCAITQLMCTDQ